MITEMVEQIKKMQVEKNIALCAAEIVKMMTDTELEDFANETNIKRFIFTAKMAMTGQHPRTGETLSERDCKNARVDLRQMIARLLCNKAIVR